MQRRIQVLNVANKCLPGNDYRMRYSSYGQVADVTFALPDKPKSLSDSEYVSSGFREGISVGDICHFVSLGRHLLRHHEKYDLLHCFSTKLQLIGPLVANLVGTKSISTITGFGRTFNRSELRFRALRPFYLALLRRSVIAAEAVFFQNHGDMEWLQAQFPELAEKMHWIGSGIEAQVQSQKDFESDRLRVLMVARLMNDKGVREFLRVAHECSGSSFRFVLAGPPSVGQEALFAEVQQADRDGIIEYLGELDQQQLSQQYQEGHVFLFPSHGEGMPRVMLEAGYGLLCPIASDIPAHRDLVKPGGGFIADKFRVVESMVEKLQQIESDRALLKNNAIAFQRHVTEQFSVSAYAARIDSHLRRLFPEYPDHTSEYPDYTSSPNEEWFAKSA